MQSPLLLILVAVKPLDCPPPTLMPLLRVPMGSVSAPAAMSASALRKPQIFTVPSPDAEYRRSPALLAHRYQMRDEWPLRSVETVQMSPATSPLLAPLVMAGVSAVAAEDNPLGPSTGQSLMVVSLDPDAKYYPSCPTNVTNLTFCEWPTNVLLAAFGSTSHSKSRTSVVTFGVVLG